MGGIYELFDVATGVYRLSEAQTGCKRALFGQDSPSNHRSKHRVSFGTTTVVEQNIHQCMEERNGHTLIRGALDRNCYHVCRVVVSVALDIFVHALQISLVSLSLSARPLFSSS